MALNLAPSPAPGSSHSDSQQRPLDRKAEALHAPRYHLHQLLDLAAPPPFGWDPPEFLARARTMVQGGEEATAEDTRGAEWERGLRGEVRYGVEAWVLQLEARVGAWWEVLDPSPAPSPSADP